MSGFLRQILTDQEEGEGLIILRKDELLGALHVGPTTANAGNLHVHEDNAAGREIARVHCNATYGSVLKGPFEHASKTLFWTVVGTANHGQLFAWKDAAGRRHNF